MVRAKNSNAIQYVAGQVPEKPEDIQRFLLDELAKLQQVIQSLATGHYDITTVAPLKPRSGDVRYADGTLWNPSAGGEGFYGYYAGSWKKLG